MQGLGRRKQGLGQIEQGQGQWQLGQGQWEQGEGPSAHIEQTVISATTRQGNLYKRRPQKFWNSDSLVHTNRNSTKYLHTRGAYTVQHIKTNIQYRAN